MIDIKSWLHLRQAEWVLVCFFAYIALISPWFPGRPNLRYQPAVILAAVFALFSLLARAQKGRFAVTIDLIRDWLPLVLTLAAFREMELFLPTRFEHRYESTWIAWDHVFLNEWHLRSIIESLGGIIPLYLELCYLVVYATGFFCVLVLYLQHRRGCIDRFVVIYLTGTLLAYGLFPYFPSQPPRILFPQHDHPVLMTWIRSLNLWILKIGTIHVGVFPSAHVSSVFSAAWGMFLVMPGRKLVGWGLICYAVSVSLATIYGRYHYAADVLAGLAISGVPALMALGMRKRR